MLPWLLIAAVIVVLDQASKWAALKYLVRHAEVQVLPFLNFTLAFNAGAAFGFLSDQPGWQHFLFVTIALVAIGVITYILRASVKHLWQAWSLTLILAGAVGNLIDRLRFGYVVDFIDVVFGGWHFWTFNIADSAISIGAAMLVLEALGFKFTRPRSSESPS
jgi:signal peptidase II